MPQRPPKLDQRRQTRGAEERERKSRLDLHRPGARGRGYDADWQALRDEIVVERGCICEAPGCGRLVSLRKRDASAAVPCAHVDHIVSVRERPDLRLDRSNLRLLCEPCHNARTARDQGFGKAR